MNRQIVALVGGGHAHLEVIRRISEQTLSGTTRSGPGWILISPDPYSIYSGMVPGVIAGHYQPMQAMINLADLCRKGEVKWIQARVTQINPSQKCLYLSSGQQISYDIVSFDIGSATDASEIGGNTTGITVKPISTLLERWQSFVSNCQRRSRPGSLVVVGGGVAGVELVLAARHRLHHLQCHLVSGGELLKGHNVLVKRKVKSIIAKRNITLWEYCAVDKVTEQGSDSIFDIQLSDCSRLSAETVMIATQARGHNWIKASGLPCDERGFIRVNSTLQVMGYSDHFAVGDVASFDPPLAKAGVYPVRQAATLAHNLMAQVLGEELRNFEPQTRFLSLIATGERHAVASRGWLFCSGRWVWQWKDYIDRQFVERYQL